MQQGIFPLQLKYHHTSINDIHANIHLFFTLHQSRTATL